MKSLKLYSPNGQAFTKIRTKYPNYITLPTEIEWSESGRAIAYHGSAKFEYRNLSALCAEYQIDEALVRQAIEPAELLIEVESRDPDMKLNSKISVLESTYVDIKDLATRCGLTRGQVIDALMHYGRERLLQKHAHISAAISQPLDRET